MKEWICREMSTATRDAENGILMMETELIRCKDCKHRDEQSANCTRFRKDWFVQSNSFCSWAERKEE